MVALLRTYSAFLCPILLGCLTSCSATSATPPQAPAGEDAADPEPERRAVTEHTDSSFPMRRTLVPNRGANVLMSWSVTELPEMSRERHDKAELYSVDEILRKNLVTTDWSELYLLLVAALAPGEAVVPGLVDQVRRNKVVGISNGKRLIIWERIASGDLLFEGKGIQIEDDLFSVAGRANWMLRHLTSQDFGHVQPDTSEATLREIAQSWTSWLGGEEVASFANPYPTSVSGLSEIRSKAALEALIVSLKRSSSKATLTENCLRNVYHLERMPEDSSSPAHLCDPDTYTHRYLGVLTGVSESHDYAWWKEWWSENEPHLVWQEESGVFEEQESER